MVRRLTALVIALAACSLGAYLGAWWVPFSVRARYAWLLRRRGESARAASLAHDAEKAALKVLATGTRAAELNELAGLRLLRGDRSGAMSALTKAFESGTRDYGFLEADPMLEPLRSTPAFRALMGRMKSDVALQRKRAADRGLLELASLRAPTH